MRSNSPLEPATATRRPSPKLMRAFAALAVLTALRLQPTWLPAPDAAQEALVALRRHIEAGSTTIAVELPSVIQATFERLRESPDHD
jgi:hypothetical protein